MPFAKMQNLADIANPEHPSHHITTPSQPPRTPLHPGSDVYKGKYHSHTENVKKQQQENNSCETATTVTTQANTIA